MICKRKTTVKKITDSIVISSTTEVRKGKTSYSVEAIRVLEDGWEEVLTGHYNLKNKNEANSFYLKTVERIISGEIG